MGLIEKFACGGKIGKDKKGKQIIQLNGDQRNDVKDLLIEEDMSEFSAA